MAKLDALEQVSCASVTEAELAALELARDDLSTQKTAGGWQAHTKKGTSLWGEKRQILHMAAPKHGLRWPSWLGKIESALPPMGTTPAARDQTMYAIERAACGLGLDYRAWPEGVGVLLSNREGASPRPRLLTLGSDTEALRREGQRLEHRFGRDAGNGWAYNHALNKLRLYQEKVLKELWDESPTAPSVRELEDRGVMMGVAVEEADDEEDVPLSRRQNRDKAPTPAPPPYAYREGERVEVRVGDEWRTARVDNVNEDDETYDVILQDGDEEEGVTTDRLRAL